MSSDKCACGHSITKHHVNGGQVCMYLTPELACAGPCGFECECGITVATNGLCFMGLHPVGKPA